MKYNNLPKSNFYLIAKVPEYFGIPETIGDFVPPKWKDDIIYSIWAPSEKDAVTLYAKDFNITEKAKFNSLSSENVTFFTFSALSYRFKVAKAKKYTAKIKKKTCNFIFYDQITDDDLICFAAYEYLKKHPGAFYLIDVEIEKKNENENEISGYFKVRKGKVIFSEKITIKRIV